LKTNILKVLALILISSMLVVPVNASESDFSIMENNPQIVIKSDYAEEGTRVSVKVLESDYVKEETVFYGTVKPNEPLVLTPEISQDIFNDEVQIIDLVYNVTLVSPDNHIQMEYVSIPYVSEKHPIKHDVISELNNLQTVTIESNFNQDNHYNIPKVGTAPNNSMSLAAAPNYLSCERLDSFVEKCILETRGYSVPTKIATVHVGDGEKVKFNFKTGANIKVGIGYKKGSSWTVEGTTSKSINSTLHYDFTGSSSTNTQYDLYANVDYVYEKFDLVALPSSGGSAGQRIVIGTEYKLIPGKVIGPADTPIKSVKNSNNGKPASEVLADKWGANFTIQSVTGLTKYYSVESTFSGGLSIATPAGTFTSSVSTSYVKSHEIAYSVPSGSKYKYLHYDLDRKGKEFYVTRALK